MSGLHFKREAFNYAKIYSSASLVLSRLTIERRRSPRNSGVRTALARVPRLVFRGVPVSDHANAGGIAMRPAPNELARSPFCQPIEPDRYQATV